MLLGKQLRPLFWTVYLTTFYACGCLGQLNVCGQDAPAGNWPWQASLHFVISGVPSSFLCGGSLINDQWVLSAANCFSSVSSSDLEVYLGRQNQEGSNPNEVKRTVSRIITHPSFHPVTRDNDIALLRLSAPVTFTNFISPVCLAASGSVFLNGVDSWVTGWGEIAEGEPLPSPGTLKEVEVAVIENTHCQSLYEAVPFNVTDNMICAGKLAGGKDSCKGDSGGPLVSQQDSVWVQSGIVSLEGCAQPNPTGVYTRVSRYESWINSEISTNQPGFVLFTVNSTVPSPSASKAPEPTSTSIPHELIKPSAFTPAVTNLPALSSAPVPTSTSAPQELIKPSAFTPAVTNLPALSSAPVPTSTSAPQGKVCLSDRINEIAIPVVTVTTSITCNNSIVHLIAKASRELLTDPSFDQINPNDVELICATSNTLKVSEWFKVIIPGQLCFPDNTIVMRTIEATRNQKAMPTITIERTSNAVVTFETDLEFVDCATRRGHIIKVINNISVEQYGVVYRRTLVICRKPESGRTKREVTVGSVMELQQAFDIDSTSNSSSNSNSSSRASTPTFPTTDEIVAVLRTAAQQLNFTLNETSINFTRAARQSPGTTPSVTSGMTTNVMPVQTTTFQANANQNTTSGSPGLWSAFSCLAMVLFSLQLMVQWLAL
ncbi:mucin-5AC-like isoform X3 [Alosa alosa]|uniref:mucin-5AC-like isoform X3 n=1 Tax=Alosa alosa TaxID=278164 RepID=UPI0020151553|nr:mucin-5AC-like isoform X3 [Alosa alosa]